MIVQPPAEFAAWEQAQLRVPPTPTDGAAADGARLFQERTCQNCHTIAGTPATGNVGPDLTHLAGRETLGAGVLDNNLMNLTRWLKNPQLLKPGCYMPDLRLTKTEAQSTAKQPGQHQISARPKPGAFIAAKRASNDTSRPSTYSHPQGTQ